MYEIGCRCFKKESLSSMVIFALREVLYQVIKLFLFAWFYRQIRRVYPIKYSCSLGTKFKPFLDLILELSVEKGVFNDREIREHVDTMIVGGHDTSANVLMFTMILLGSHPEIQERVYAE